MSWDADSDFEPELNQAKSTPNDKWDGEDEDDDVKDAWDCDSEEEKSKEEPAKEPAAAKASKKKKLRDKIALKEAQNAEEGDDRELTAEEKLAEKMRLQKLEESSQMALTRDMLGKTIPLAN